MINAITVTSETIIHRFTASYFVTLGETRLQYYQHRKLRKIDFVLRCANMCLIWLLWTVFCVWSSEFQLFTRLKLAGFFQLSTWLMILDYKCSSSSMRKSISALCPVRTVKLGSFLIKTGTLGLRVSPSILELRLRSNVLVSFSCFRSRILQGHPYQLNAKPDIKIELWTLYSYN